MREEGGLTAIESAIDKLSKHHIRHIKAYDPNEGKDHFCIPQNFHHWKIIWRKKFKVEGILILNDGKIEGGADKRGDDKAVGF